MASQMGLLFAAIVCVTGMTAYAQVANPVSSEAIILRLGEGARLEGMRLAASPAASRAQSPTGASEYRTVKWGILIGAIAGVTGGALQPTHSNGEYVLGNSRFTSALALGGIGAGAGALVGLAIDKRRK